MFMLSIAALVFATLFAGAALYISLVQHPARLGLADEPMLAHWQPSYKRALPIQSGLAITGGAAGLVAGYLSADWRWFAGSLLLLANWPFTLLVIMPVNKRLMAMPISDAGRHRRRGRNDGICRRTLLHFLCRTTSADHAFECTADSWVSVSESSLNGLIIIEQRCHRPARKCPVGHLPVMEHDESMMSWIPHDACEGAIHAVGFPFKYLEKPSPVAPQKARDAAAPVVEARDFQDCPQRLIGHEVFG